MYKSSSSMRIKRNGRNMVVTHKSNVARYHKNIWFRNRAITNIITLSNVIQQYRVIYDSEEKMLIVHREAEVNQIWSSGCTRTGCINMARSINTSHSSTMSLETRKVTPRDRSKAQKSLGPFMSSYATHPGKSSSGLLESTRSTTFL